VVAAADRIHSGKVFRSKKRILSSNSEEKP
jgi:hypothetical protein